MIKKLCIISISVFFSACNSSENSSENNTSSDNIEIEISAVPDSFIKDTDTFETEEETRQEQQDLKEWAEQTGVYIWDTDELPTNVRKEPKGEVILKLPKTGDYEVWLKGEQNGWFLVDEIQEINENKIFENVNGYIHGSVLAAATTNYGGEEYYLYKDANERSDIVFSFDQESMVFLISSNINGNWLKVEIKKDNKKYRGWIQASKLCGSIRTNCS